MKVSDVVAADPLVGLCSSTCIHVCLVEFALAARLQITRVSDTR